jgi:hypothetical protein
MQPREPTGAHLNGPPPKGPSSRRGVVRQNGPMTGRSGTHRALIVLFAVVALALLVTGALVVLGHGTLSQESKEAIEASSLPTAGDPDASVRFTTSNVTVVLGGTSALFITIFGLFLRAYKFLLTILILPLLFIVSPPEVTVIEATIYDPPGDAWATPPWSLEAHVENAWASADAMLKPGDYQSISAKEDKRMYIIAFALTGGLLVSAGVLARRFISGS